jgi:phage terminase large subunit-like protein
VPEGKDIGKEVVLRDWQKLEICKIYDNPAGTRRAIISFGRKNGKTALAAFLLLLHLCGPRAKPNSQLYSAAQSREQAAVIFALAAKIVRLSPTLRDAVVIRDTAKQLAFPGAGTLYRALSAEVSTAFGLSPSFIVHDELGQVRGPRSELYDALETATGAQENPLSLVISTQAPTDADLLSDLIDKGLAGDDPRVVVSLYTAPQEDDPFTEETIKKANPAFGDFLNPVEVKAMARDAELSPARESSFRNLVLNQRVEARSPFVSRNLWESCGNKSPVKPIERVPVYGGLDLSEIKDLTALVLIGKVDEVWQVHPTFWLPEEGLREKSRNDRLPYDLWRKEKYLLTAPGKSVDYEYVALYLKEMFERYDIRKLAFDRWNFRHFEPWLLKAGFTVAEIKDKFVEFGQGFQSMSPALRDFEGEILNGRISHGNHPVLKMCAANAVVQTDPAGNRKLTKVRSTGRIDGMVALVMAFGAAPNTVATPEYKIHFI